MFGLPRKTLSLIIATSTLLAGCQRGPNPADTVRNAYGWYLRELKSGVNPLEQKRAELKEFVTDNFLASCANMRSELESSPLWMRRASMPNCRLRRLRAIAGPRPCELD